MSGGTACPSVATTDHSGHRHVVTQRRSNRSAFNGYRLTPSRYSEVVCLDTGNIWRTAAAYANGLPDAPDDWYNQLWTVAP